jgi:hypothetical protein
MPGFLDGLTGLFGQPRFRYLSLALDQNLVNLVRILGVIPQGSTYLLRRKRGNKGISLTNAHKYSIPLYIGQRPVDAFLGSLPGSCWERTLIPLGQVSDFSAHQRLSGSGTTRNRLVSEAGR